MRIREQDQAASQDHLGKKGAAHKHSKDMITLPPMVLSAMCLFDCCTACFAHLYPDSLLSRGVSAWRGGSELQLSVQILLYVGLDFGPQLAQAKTQSCSKATLAFSRL